MRAPRLLFESPILRAARDARRNAPGGTVVQLLDTLAELLQAERFIPVLAALLATSHDQTGGQVFEPHCAFRLVDVLAAWAARTKGVALTLSQQFFV